MYFESIDGVLGALDDKKLRNVDFEVGNACICKKQLQNASLPRLDKSTACQAPFRTSHMHPKVLRIKLLWIHKGYTTNSTKL